MSPRHAIIFDEDVSVMSDSVRDQIPFAVALLGIIGLLGSLGNSLVLCVYARKTDKQTASLFILVLALADFHTCVVIIPFTIVNELMLWRIGSSVLCKVYYLLNASSIPFSSLLISAIAVDRFLCICYPFLRAMTVRRAKILVLVLAGMSMTLGSLAAWFARMYVVQSSPSNTTTSNLTTITKHPVHENHIDPQPECTSKPSSAQSQKMFYIVIQKANHVCFAVCIVSVVLLYILIYRTILQLRKRRRDKLTGFRFKTVVNNNNNNNNQEGGASSLPALNSTLSTSNNTLHQQRESNQLIQNMKTAVILFVVAVVFIATFVPALLMASELLDLNLVGFYLYYLNSAANPVIYGFMNPNFRDAVQQLLCSGKPPAEPAGNVPLVDNNEQSEVAPFITPTPPLLAIPIKETLL